MPLRRARRAIVVVFVALGFYSASWAPRIPAVKAALHLSAPALGLALLAAAAGLVAAAPVAGVVLHRAPPRRVMAVGFVPFAAALPFVAVVRSGPALAAVLFAWGFGSGLIDVAMNVAAVAIETAQGRRIMAGFHAGYSVGGLVGAAVGAGAAAIGLSVGVHLTAAGILVGAVGLAAVAAVPALPPPPTTDQPRRLPPLSRPLVALAAIGLGSFLAEGATNDWSAVELHSSLGASSGLAAFGYTAFALTMAGGRVCGDRIVTRLGARRAVRWSVIAGGGLFAVSLCVGDPVVGVLGFAALGVGLANVVPQVFTSAGRLGSPGPSLAVVTGSGYTGLMIGPALIGGLAGLVGVRTALAVVVVVCAAIALLAGSLRDRLEPEVPRVEVLT